MSDQRFARHLRVWRNARGYSQSGLDRLLGVGAGFVGGLESGRKRPPGEVVLAKIADVLRVDHGMVVDTAALDLMERRGGDWLLRWHQRKLGEVSGAPQEPTALLKVALKGVLRRLDAVEHERDRLIEQEAKLREALTAIGAPWLRWPEED